MKRRSSSRSFTTSACCGLFGSIPLANEWIIIAGTLRSPAPKSCAVAPRSSSSRHSRQWFSMLFTLSTERGPRLPSATCHKSSRAEFSVLMGSGFGVVLSRRERAHRTPAGTASA